MTQRYQGMYWSDYVMQSVILWCEMRTKHRSVGGWGLTVNRKEAQIHYSLNTTPLITRRQSMAKSDFFMLN